MKKQTQPIRILHVVTIMNRGGLETMIMNYYRKIDRSKIQFDFIVHRQSKGDFDDEIKSLGGNIYYLSPISFKNLSRYNQQFSQFLSEHPEYKIIHSHLDALSALPLSVAKKMKIPVRIAHSHTSSFDKNIRYIIRNITKKFIKFYATDYFGCSYDAIKFMFGNVNDYKIINNAINAGMFAFNLHNRKKVRKELKIDNKFVIGHVGRFNYPKNHEFLVDIFYEIHKTNKKALLLLVGAGEEKKHIQEKVLKLGLAESVLFLGLRADVADLMQAMDVFVMPSRYEGLPVVSVEAQASGLPSFFSDVVTKDIKVSHFCYFISLEASPKLWAKEILRVVGISRRPMLKEIQAFGFDIDDQAKKLEAIYLRRYKA